MTDISDYCAMYSSPLPPIAESILNKTLARLDGHMTVGRLTAELLRFMIVSHKYETIAEVGSLIGFSAISMALALPLGGKIWTIEENENVYEELVFNVNTYYLNSIITPILSEGIDWLKKINRKFDMLFLDARKEDYAENYSTITSSVASGGTLIIDNTFCKGGVLNPQKKWEKSIAEVNSRLSRDSMFQVVLLPIRDGITIAYKP